MEPDAVAGRPCARLPVAGQAGVVGEELGEEDGDGEPVPVPP